MSNTAPPCRTITVFAFRGDRSRRFAATFRKALDDEKNGCGSAPTVLECLLFTGHVGVSMDGGMTIWGFNPAGGHLPIWQMMDRLKNGGAFPGAVRDDTAMFSVAGTRGRTILSIRMILPESPFLDFQRRLDDERKTSQYSYGFPNGDGDCNCITWLERLGLPLLTGRMDEFVSLLGIIVLPIRRFGECV